jgi:hypothetical protein
MRKLAYVPSACVVAAVMAASTGAQDGVTGTTVRPIQVDAKVMGCTIAEPGDYQVKVGDLIELNYSHPVAPPFPQKVDFKQTLIGAVARSPLGFRAVNTPKLIGKKTIAFYFDAKKEGEDTVTLIIDKEEYTYKFKVIK